MPSTGDLHAAYHNTTNQGAKALTADLACKECDLVLSLPLDSDGAMILDDYDDHLETHI